MDYILVLRPSQVKMYRESPRFRNNSHCRITVTDGELGIAGARESCRGLVEPGEWCLQMDDNIRGFTAADPDFYHQHDQLAIAPGCRPTRAQYDLALNRPVTFARFYEQILVDSIREAASRGSNVCAFSAFENPAFRYRKWNDVSYTQNKCVLLRNTGMSWDQSNGHDTMEEYALLAAHLSEYGRVLVNKWAQPVAGHYEPGGLGPYEERLPAKRLACTDIMERYPGLFRQHKDGELVLRWREVKQIERWREKFQAA